MNNIKLIVGLSNPGNQYILTRHNLGALYVKLLAMKYDQKFKKKKYFFGYTSMINISGNNLHLLIPSTFMNMSGKSILAFINYYNIKPSEILIAHDELDLRPGIIKIKFGGTYIGHKGLKDIQCKLGINTGFYRLRIGIGHPGKTNKVVDFVLSKPNIKEYQLIYAAINEAIYCTSILINEGIMNAVQRLHTFKAFD